MEKMNIEEFKQLLQETIDNLTKIEQQYKPWFGDQAYVIAGAHIARGRVACRSALKAISIRETSVRTHTPSKEKK